MQTAFLNANEIDKAASYLKSGQVVAFPTETVYGLGADATNDEAVKRIFEAKGRPNDNPLIVHIANINQLERYVESIPEAAEKVINHFWPGPCTIVLKKKGPLAPSVTGGLDTVGVRMPDHPVALELIEKAGVPLAAPSANSSGRPSPTTALHVRHDLEGKIKAIVNGGATGVGLESTVLDLTDPEKPTILRPGGVTLEELERVLGKVWMDTHLTDEKAAPKSPGMKYTHYSPDKPVWILPETLSEAQDVLSDLEEMGEKIGFLVSDRWMDRLSSENRVGFTLGNKNKPQQAASRLFSSLRALDDEPVTIIVVEPYQKSGIGTAYMNRLEKAASRIL